MNKLLTLLFFLLNISYIVSAQTGKVFDNLSMSSKILKMDRKYAIYLPPDYDTSERSYPILYLLHGAGEDQRGWIQFGEVMTIADEAIKSGKATAMIIVMPDAFTVKRGYVNDILDEWRYEDFFFQEFMPYIEQKYRIIGQKRYRAVAGLSMGGEGSFIYALHHPELFSSACPLSAATGPHNIEVLKTGDRWGQPGNPSEIEKENYLKKYNVLTLLENMPEEQKKSVRWYIDCGDDDGLYERNCLAHIIMRKNNIPHEFRVRDGGHTWTYWRTALPEVLSFVSISFRQL